MVTEVNAPCLNRRDSQVPFSLDKTPHSRRTTDVDLKALLKAMLDNMADSEMIWYMSGINGQNVTSKQHSSLTWGSPFWLDITNQTEKSIQEMRRIDPWIIVPVCSKQTLALLSLVFTVFILLTWTSYIFTESFFYARVENSKLANTNTLKVLHTHPISQVTIAFEWPKHQQ